MENLAEIQVSYKTPNIPRVKITSSNKAYDILLKCWTQEILELQEEFKVILLNRSNEVLGVYSLSKGGITGTLVDTRLLFAVALKCVATSFIIAHNHPSGNLNPSSEDRILTNKIRNGADLLDLKLLDHLIVTKNGYYSFGDQGDL